MDEGEGEVTGNGEPPVWPRNRVDQLVLRGGKQRRRFSPKVQPPVVPIEADVDVGGSQSNIAPMSVTLWKDLYGSWRMDLFGRNTAHGNSSD